MSSTGDGCEGEDTLSSSSSLSTSPIAADLNVVSNSETNAFDSMKTQFNSALEEFRNNWQLELEKKTKNLDSESSSDESDDATEESAMKSKEEDQQEMLAENLFRKGIEHEQCGKVYDAMYYYKKAVQLVPDIEFKFYEKNFKTNSAINSNKTDSKSSSQSSLYTVTYSEMTTRELVSQFYMDLNKQGKFISNLREAGVISTEVHISELPIEIIHLIMKWIVSDQLDLRSLEFCSAVCKGFYICARDEEIWRQACFKVWGPCDLLTSHPTKEFTSWRQMYIERDRVNFHGCYISRATYLRMGENCFQDQYYRPIHVIEYFRYIRFIPDGCVYMMTSSDQPIFGVAKMNNLSQQRSDILRGTYHLNGDTVSVVLKKKHKAGRNGRGCASNDGGFDASITTYYIEFNIVCTPKGKFQLVWKNYSIKQLVNEVETTSEFELIPTRYPPLRFSPVRSYHTTSYAPLN